jgi:hypothetical protein
MRKSRKLRRSHKTKKRRGGSWWWPFGSSESTEGTPKSKETPPAVGSVTVSSNITNGSKVKAPLPAIPTNGATTQLEPSKKGGMAPINMKEPMFYPTQRELEWATTAGLPTKGGSRRRKKSKRKSRR